MIDFHSHILPQIDDGARTVEETFELLNEAVSVGFSGIIFTPHYVESYYERSAKEIKALYEDYEKQLDIEVAQEVEKEFKQKLDMKDIKRAELLLKVDPLINEAVNQNNLRGLFIKELLSKLNNKEIGEEDFQKILAIVFEAME